MKIEPEPEPNRTTIVLARSAIARDRCERAVAVLGCLIQELSECALNPDELIVSQTLLARGALHQALMELETIVAARRDETEQEVRDMFNTAADGIDPEEYRDLQRAASEARRSPEFKWEAVEAGRTLIEVVTPLAPRLGLDIGKVDHANFLVGTCVNAALSCDRKQPPEQEEPDGNVC